MYAKKGDLSRNSVRNLTSAERIRYLYTKAQRDCDILRIRLKALRERHRQEQEEIKKLQAHLTIFDSDIQDEYESEVSETQSKRRKTSIIVEDAEEEDEYEKLLREVRKMKQDILNQREPFTASKNVLQKNVDSRSESYIKYEQVAVEDGEIVGEIYEDCNQSVNKISEESDVELKSLDNECKEQDYLEPVITDK
ncbi:hypothetical protein KM043_004981 [Ampulex compressa]|nr:hypothetical protein KM043_004981 [Ampulex compressa]